MALKYRKSKNIIEEDKEVFFNEDIDYYDSDIDINKDNNVSQRLIEYLDNRKKKAKKREMFRRVEKTKYGYLANKSTNIRNNKKPSKSNINNFKSNEINELDSKLDSNVMESIVNKIEPETKLEINKIISKFKTKKRKNTRRKISNYKKSYIKLHDKDYMKCPSPKNTSAYIYSNQTKKEPCSHFLAKDGELDEKIIDNGGVNFFNEYEYITEPFNKNNGAATLHTFKKWKRRLSKLSKNLN